MGSLLLAVALARGAEPAPPKEAGPGGPAEPRRVQQTAQIKAAIKRGLSYLARQQKRDGSWQSTWTHGVSGLALAAFLGENLPEHQANSKRAVDFFRKSYIPPGGGDDLHSGSLVGMNPPSYIYEHAIAVLALAEHVRADPKDSQAVSMLIEGAKLLVHSQATRERPPSLNGPIGPDNPSFGGWRYSPNSADADLSASGWCIVALFAAKDALDAADKTGIVRAPFQVPESAFRDFMAYCRKCFDENQNGYCYTPNGGSNNTNTSIGVLSTILCKEYKNCPLLPKGVATLRKHLPNWDGDDGTGHNPLYYWYYATRAMWLLGGAPWDQWENVVCPMLLHHQSRDGSWTVSGNDDAGVAYSTALAVLILQLCSGSAPPFMADFKTETQAASVAPRRTGEYPIYTAWPFDAAEAKKRQEQTAQGAGLPIEEAADFGTAGKMKLLLVPAGEFMMGSPLDDKALKERWPNAPTGADRDDLPRHRVRLTKPFYAAQTEVTRAQFALFAKEANYTTDAERQGRAYGLKNGKWELTNGLTWRDPGFPQTDGDPAVCLSWNDARAFCDWLSKREGKPYGLLTEAQWEYACRAGSDALWPWGDREQDAQSKASVQGEDEGAEFFFRSVRDGFKLAPAPVAAFATNAFGLNDMIGNIGEWCGDWYGQRYYAESPASDPMGPPDPQDANESADATKPKRLARGGSWGSPPWLTTSCSRCPLTPEMGHTHTGFRIARRLDEALRTIKVSAVKNTGEWLAFGGEGSYQGPPEPPVVIPNLPTGVQEMFIVLTWDKNADIDLHVTEPDGQRCYYGHMKTRTGGTLDNDDRKGRGPETYRPGTQRYGGPYKVEVCYYGGSRQAVKATVRVYRQFQGADQACVGIYEITLPGPNRRNRLPVITVDLPGVVPHDPGPWVTTVRGDPRPPAK